MKQKTKRILWGFLFLGAGFVLGLASMAELHRQAYNIGFWSGYNLGYDKALGQI